MRHGENGLVFKDAEELATQLQVVGPLHDPCFSHRAAVVELWGVKKGASAEGLSLEN